ncbi:MAG TPA: sulfatase-like hydrolase/transferase [Thermoanaerobaculia bacterium]|jgi:arylsulfatase A-like enzyme/Flp pilus assembly protein TadD|nr:sulfatase-like hydrolase/transferase [Thermoanaerobaculia bacterium]
MTYSHPASTASRQVTMRGLAVLLLLTVACSRQAVVDPKAPIIIISIDTLRSDHLPAYGYTKIETPAIDLFRKDAVLFERAYSHCPLTLVSHASVFTGLLPAEHGIRDNLGYTLNPKVPTIAEFLKSKGYATGGAVSALVLRGETGIKRGFDFWDDSIDFDVNALSIGRAQRSGDETRQIAEKWIGEHKSAPFFFFFHIYEPHTPYEPPDQFRSKYGNSYDGEVATSDDVVGRFLAYLREQGVYDKATIILMSDHGEGLGDHGEDEHGILLYRETLQVPLIVKFSRSAQKGMSIAAPVQLVDIYPTITGAFETMKSEGVSLARIAHGEGVGERDIYSETYYPRLHFGWSDMHSIIAGANHYIHSPKPELYDVVADPAESKNVLIEKRRDYVALRDRIQPFIHAAKAPAAVDDEQKQQLLALGYVGSSVTTLNDAVLPDPRENIGKANLIGKAFYAFKQQRYAEAFAITTNLLRDNPNMLDIWSLQTRVLERLGRTEEAIAAAKQGLRLDPGSTSLAIAVANLSLHSGHLDDAEAHAKLALKSTPAEAHRVLTEIALERKDWPRARQEALAAGSQHRDAPLSQMLLGRVALGEGKPEEALQYFDHARSALVASHRRLLPGLGYLRGDALARLGRGEEAEQAFVAEIKRDPADPQPYKNLILLYAVENRTDEATQLIFALEKASPTPPSYVAISETLKTIGDARGAKFWASRGLSRYPSDKQLQSLYRG